MSCADCIARREAYRAQKMKVVAEATKYAKNNNISVVIYHEGPTWKFIDIDSAHAKGIDFREVIPVPA